MSAEQRLGYLRTCIDRRFVENVRKEFEKTTGLGPGAYWHESNPGGAANKIDPLGADYAYSHGARTMGWSAHGSHCGGNPGKSDEEIAAALDQAIVEAKNKYPQAEHYRIFSTEAGTTISKI